jgi:hypothetical protein
MAPTAPQCAQSHWSSDALRLAVERGLYAYDAYVATLAHDRRLPLLTLDQPLGRVAAAMGVSLWEF